MPLPDVILENYGTGVVFVLFNLKGHVLLRKYPNNILYPITQSNINFIIAIPSNLRRVSPRRFVL